MYAAADDLEDEFQQLWKQAGLHKMVAQMERQQRSRHQPARMPGSPGGQQGHHPLHRSACKRNTMQSTLAANLESRSLHSSPCSALSLALAPQHLQHPINTPSKRPTAMLLDRKQPKPDSKLHHVHSTKVPVFDALPQLPCVHITRKCSTVPATPQA